MTEFEIAIWIVFSALAFCAGAGCGIELMYRWYPELYTIVRSRKP